jgi:hypothetical protein
MQHRVIAQRQRQFTVTGTRTEGSGGKGTASPDEITVRQRRLSRPPMS